jgi:hypothetical protein
MANYSFKTASLPIPDGRVIELCNFCQLVPHTVIYAGETGLTFRNCNLTNCDVPGDSIIECCLRIQVEFCSHLHEKWIEKGLTACAENCAIPMKTRRCPNGSNIVLCQHRRTCGMER